MPEFTAGATDDAARDALALLRAQLLGDDEAAAAVAANMSWPEMTAAILAQWQAELMRMTGLGLETLDRVQDGSGLW